MDREFTMGAAGAKRKLNWHYPSRTECMVCHSRAANYVLGFTEVQFNKVNDYGGVRDNQLRVLEPPGVLKANYWESTPNPLPHPTQPQAQPATQPNTHL